MLFVNNSGLGNCMYYAYGISLMYFLRSKNNSKITETIFNKLGLEQEHKTLLTNLLNKPPHQEFTKEEIQCIIEPILGTATRNLAAEHTRNEFKQSPQATSLFTAAKYGLEYQFKRASKANNLVFSKLISHEFNNKNYTEAEIYRVEGMEKAMQLYVEAILPEVNELFHAQWTRKEHELNRLNKHLTKNDLDLILDNILQEKTVEFFLVKNEYYLNQYVNHLKKEFVWGTEETLMVLHRAVQGERLERNTKGTIDTHYDTPINLQVHKNNREIFNSSTRPEIILNNQANAHWTSKIPETIFTKFSRIEPVGKNQVVTSPAAATNQLNPRPTAALDAVVTSPYQSTETFFSPLRNIIKALWQEEQYTEESVLKRPKLQ